MRGPFPGMDPYLEASHIWPDVHNRLMYVICDLLQPELAPRYSAVITPYVSLETIEVGPARLFVPDVAVFDSRPRAPLPEEGSAVAIAEAPVTLIGIAGVPTRLARIEIRAVGDGQLVTTIELLSPANKRPGADGADAYARKRAAFFDSDTHLLEIDLLRGGVRPEHASRTPTPAADYMVFLSRANRRPFVSAWPIGLDTRLPTVPVPLTPPDRDVALPLQLAIERVYVSARYDLRLDYREDPPPPPLGDERHAWLDAHLRAAGLRPTSAA